MVSSLLVIFCLAFILIFSNNAQSDDSIVIIGGYSEEEGLLFASLDEEDGSLSLINGPFNIGPNPSTITVNQQPGFNMIYTVNEAGGSKASIVTVPFDPANNYSIDTDSMITQSAYGETPCYVSHDVNYTFVYLANYGGGGNSSFAVFKINQDTGYLSSQPIVYKRFDSPGVTSHVHCILPNPNDALNFYIADLGRNVVEHYQIIDNGNDAYDLKLVSWIDFPPNSGPRTMAYNPVMDGIIYLSQEIGNRISVLSFDVVTYKLLDNKQTLSTLYSNMSNEDSACSHVMSDNEGKYVYVANRFTDNIASFTINRNNGLLIADSLYLNECGGEIPRSFNIDPTNNYLLVCDQEGDETNNVATFKIDHENGHLTQVSQFVRPVRPAWAYIL